VGSLKKINNLFIKDIFHGYCLKRQSLKDKSATSAGGFLKRLIDKAPFTINKLLTDNGKEFTDRFCATRPAPTPSIESAPITVSSIASSSPGPHKPTA